jgi:peptidoglycan/xylan/chitin deacetylase (PgdA/CDA1 family)
MKLFLLFGLIGWAHGVFAANHGVVLVYHHVATDTPPSTSVSPERFVEHLELIQALGFTVWPLSRLVSDLHNGIDVPGSVVALTFDDASASLPQFAIPELVKRDWPFTLFVHTEAVGVQSNVMTWTQLHDAVSAGGEIGNHSHAHRHWVADASNLSVIRDDISQAQHLLRTHLQVEPVLVAYPYGEYNDAIQSVVKQLKLYGVSQQSGALGHLSDFLAIPRFPVATGYDDPQQLRLKLQSRPLYIDADPSQGSQILTSEQQVHVRLRDAAAFDLQRLTCFQNGRAIELDATAGGWVFTLDTPQPGRHKVNCTAPHSTERGVYGWWSYLGMRISPPPPSERRKVSAR